ncbi:MAG: hypothetical protein Q9157_009074, partial [Trypethelium eluteriae]
MRFSTAAVAAAAFASGVVATGEDESSYSGSVAYTTEIVTHLTTYCPESTSLTVGGSTYTVSEATTLTISDCSCTVTKPVTTPVSTS